MKLTGILILVFAAIMFISCSDDKKKTETTDSDTVVAADEDTIVADEDAVSGDSKLGDTCATSADCKGEFDYCINPLSASGVENINTCTKQNCDPAKAGDCAENYTCVDFTNVPGMGDVSAAMGATSACVILKDTAKPDDDDVSDDDSIISDTPECYGDECADHTVCKKEGCEATFCTAGLKAAGFTDKSVCIVRCDPANNGSECMEGQICDGNVALAAAAGVDVDGAKGVCKPK